MGLHQDVTLWQHYCTALDGQGPEESNHVALIMPAIKHMRPENSKWKSNLTGDKMRHLIQSCKEQTDDKSSLIPSAAQLDNLMALLQNPKPSKLSNAKEQVDELSIASTTAVRRRAQSHMYDESSLPSNANPLNFNQFHSNDNIKSSGSIVHSQYTFSRMAPTTDICKQNNSNIRDGNGCGSEAAERRKYSTERDLLVHIGNGETQPTFDCPLRDIPALLHDGGQRKQNSNFLSNPNHTFFNNENSVDFPINIPVSRDSSEYQLMLHESVSKCQGQYRGRGFSGAPPGTSAGRRGAVGARGVGGRYPWQRGRGAVVTAPIAAPSAGSFRTASHQLILNQARQRGSHQGSSSYNSLSDCEGQQQQQGGGVRPEQYGSGRSLGLRPSSSVSGKFVPPIRKDEGAAAPHSAGDAAAHDLEAGSYADLMADPRMKNIEAKMVELIMNEVLDSGLDVAWDDIAGLQQAKDTIQEVVVWPMLRPDIFTGLRGPPKGVLLFGPPGTGKTMIGKAIASQSGATFFSISASCLTSKWVGEGEKMVRALFAVARVQAPSVIFIDEIDSLLCQRSETEHESSRRIKTEFLVQLDGVGAVRERVLVVGATNRPQELDEAARRRLQKRLYIPLPEHQARLQLVSKLLNGQQHTLTPADMSWVAAQTDGYSGADVAAVCSEAAMGPIRGISAADMKHIALHQVRAISTDDFRASVRSVRPSVCAGDLQHYCDWNRQYGIAAALGVTP